jgi:hypothetical protein
VTTAVALRPLPSGYSLCTGCRDVRERKWPSIFVNESQSLRASGTSSSMGLSDWIRSSPSLGSLRLDQVVALVKDLCEPSDVVIKVNSLDKSSS